MIRIKQGDIFEERAEAIVNPVNCVGVMGAGLAKEFKRRFHKNHIKYVHACSVGEVRIGRMFVTDVPNELHPKYVINFPTKHHFKYISRLQYIESGLDDLVLVIKERKLMSVAVPALGCGLGGLRWEKVLPSMRNKLSVLEYCHVTIFEPF